MGINWASILPYLIAGGTSAAGQIIGAKTQAGASDRAAELGYQSGQQQLNALVNMYGLERGDRAPMRAVGLNALDTLQNWKPGATNALKPVDMSKYKPNTIDLPPELRRLTTPGAGAGNALAPGASGDTGSVYGSPGFSDISTSGIHGRAAGVGGRAVTGAGIGATAGSIIPGVGTAVGAAGGAIYGGLSGLFDNDNSDQNFATEGINRVGPWVWNTVMPAVKAGSMTPDEAEQAVNQVLGQWEQSMRSTPGFNPDVLQRSVTSQRQYLQPFYDQLNQFRQGQGVA
jgi:hypothetical protein